MTRASSNEGRVFLYLGSTPTFMAVMTAEELASVIGELEPLISGRIQQVDVVAERELVLGIRVPGRTLRLLLSARTNAGRVHLVPARPAREVPGGALQTFLRQRLAGGPMLDLRAQGRSVVLDTPTARLTLRLEGGKKALLVEGPAGLAMPDLEERPPLPERFPINEAVAARYAQMLPTLRTVTVADRMLAVLKARTKKLKRLEDNVKKDRDRLVRMQADGYRGELLKPLLGRMKRGQTSVEAIDWQTGAPTQIPLDPSLGPKENLERMFRRAKKAARGLPRVEARLETIAASLEKLAAEAQRIRQADSEGLLAIAESTGVDLSGLDLPESPAPKKAAGPASHPLDRWSRRFEAQDGTEIRVGKGAVANDRLTFTGAKGDDMWLHARGTSGAHVVLRNAKGKTPHPEALLDAAVLAAHYSSAKNDGKVEVIYTEARHVKKTKGAPAGLVGISKSKTLLVEMDPARLERLFGGGRGD